MGEVDLQAELLARERRVLEQAFAIEQLELSVAQLEARLRDLTAYQSVLAAVNAPPTERGRRRPSGGGANAVRGRAAGASSPAGPGKEDLGAVVERMTRVVAKLQAAAERKPEPCPCI